MSTKPTTALATSVPVMLGLVFGGWMIGQGMRDFKAADRSVTVNGLAEREVDATLATWQIKLNTSASTMEALSANLAKNEGHLFTFLKEKGFAADEVLKAPPVVTDTRAQGYTNAENRPRYTAETTYTLTTRNIAAMKHATQTSTELVERGVELAQTWGPSGSGPAYTFDALESIKPDMIAAATADARRAATQFATDSQSTVGGIKSARQGYFSINDSDGGLPERKKVRVVTTVEFFLKD